MFFGIWWVWWLLGAFVLLCGLALYEETTPRGQAELKKRREAEAAKKRQAHLAKLPAEDYPDDCCHLGKTSRLALDQSGKELAIFESGQWSFLPYRDVLGAEIVVGDITVTKTTSSRSLAGAVIGGLAFGPAGAVVGGLGGKTQSTTHKTVNSVVLRIAARDMARPIRSVQFFEAPISDPSKAEQVASEWLSRIQIIVDENDRASY